MFGLLKRRLQGDLLATFQCLKGTGSKLERDSDRNKREWLPTDREQV